MVEPLASPVVFRHVALFRWTESATDEQKHTVYAALMELPAHIPELRSYRVGFDAGQVDGNWDFAVVADFDDAEGWRTYTMNPEHQLVLADHIRPVVAERAAVQYEY